MTTRWIAAALTAAVSLAGWGQSSSRPDSGDHFSITTQLVAQTLSGRGMRIEDRQVSLLAKVVATEPHPVLEILTVGPLDDHSSVKNSIRGTLVKLVCHNPAACLPFYATVSWPSDPIGGATGLSEATWIAGNNLLNEKPVIVMQAGTHATLVMDDSRAHIKISVISLESGIAGHRIRVASPDHKQVYIAEVVSASQVKRSF